MVFGGSMNPITLKAHFDGEKIVLDEPAQLQPDMQLIVSVLPKAKNGEAESDETHDDWLQISAAGLEYAYGDDEDEYSLNLIKEPNPDYEGR
jgi:hypothetical protein